LVEITQDGIPTTGTHRGHVKDVAHRGAASTDGAPPLGSSAVLGEGSDADQGRNLLVGDLAQLGKVAEQGAHCHRANALNQGETLGLNLEIWIRVNVPRVPSGRVASSLLMKAMRASPVMPEESAAQSRQR